jgi:hypothetical protein
VENQYTRSVCRDGNEPAQQLIREVIPRLKSYEKAYTPHERAALNVDYTRATSDALNGGLLAIKASDLAALCEREFGYDLRSVVSQKAMHDECVDQTLRRMAEHLRKCSHDAKAMLFPQGDRGGVGADDDVELHGGKTEAPGFFERVLAHQGAESLAASLRRHHVTRICDVRTPPRMILP